ARFVETGAFLGTTTEFFAKFGAPVVTAEVDPNNASHARQRLRQWKNVDLRVSDSVAVLRSLAAEPIDRSVPTFFYLDAHWNDYLPLREEAEIAFGHFARAVVMIDDFEVPDDPGYSFDDYGPGKRLDLQYLLSARTPPLSIYFPSTPSHQESGARRGSVVATANADIATVLDRISLLRRW